MAGVLAVGMVLASAGSIARAAAPEGLESATASAWIEDPGRGERSLEDDGVAGILPDASGDARLRLPVALPPGPGGFVPEVALEYSSAAGDGVAGVGWSVAFGEIACSTRFGVSSRPGGDVGCERYELNDELLVGPDDEGRYHTFEESFRRIEPRSLAGAPAVAWEVAAPDGTVARYGGTADTMVWAGGEVVRWHLRERTDPFGNRIRYEYDFSNRGLRIPLRVVYAGAQREVRFVYEARPDPIRGHPGGVPTRLSSRLAEIRVFSDGRLHQRLVLRYELSPESGRSLLVSLQRLGSDCGAEGPPLDGCTTLPADRFEYSRSAPGLAMPEPAWIPTPSANTNGLEGDPSAPVPPRYPVTVPLGQSKAYVRYRESTQIADVDGDGFPDLVYDPTFGSDRDSPPNDPSTDPMVVLNDGAGGWDIPHWTEGGAPWNEAAVWTDALRGLRFELPVFRATLVEATGGTIPVEAGPTDRTNVHLGVCAAEGVQWDRTASVQMGGPDNVQLSPYFQGSHDAVFAPEPGAARSAEARPWSHFQVADLDADGRADLVMSVRLSGAHVSLADCATGERRSLGQEQWVPGAQVRVVFRNTGSGWVLDDGRDAGDGNLADSLPPFGFVAIESPELVHRSVTDEFGPVESWPYIGNPGDGLIELARGQDGACQQVGLGGGRTDAGWVGPTSLLGPVSFDFCFNTVTMSPVFTDLDGDSFPDLILNVPHDPDALLFGYHPMVDPGLGFAGTLPRHARVEPRVWLQRPEAGPGEPRWVPAPEWALPVPHASVVHFLGEIPSDYSGASAPVPYAYPNVAAVDVGVRFADLDRDGLTDVLWAAEPFVPMPDGDLPARGVLLNRGGDLTGSGSVWCASVPVGGLAVCPEAGRYELPDPDVSFVHPLSDSWRSFTPNALAPVDLNGDGWLDLAWAQSLGLAGPERRIAWIQHPGAPGSVWQESPAHTPPMDAHLWSGQPDSFIQSSGVVMRDVNADGIVDFLASKVGEDGSNGTGELAHSHLSSGRHADRLATWHKRQGGVVRLRYETGPRQAESRLESAAHDHAIEPGIDEPPGPVLASQAHSTVVRWAHALPLLTGISVEAFDRDPEDTRIRYAHPRWCPRHRTILGHRLVERVRPDGAVIESLHYQAHGRTQRLSRERLLEGGVELRRLEEEWALVDPDQVAGAWPGAPGRPASRVGRIIRRLEVQSDASGSGGSGHRVEERLAYDDHHGRNFVAELRRISASRDVVRRRTPWPEAGTGLFGRLHVEATTAGPGGPVLALRKLLYRDDRGAPTFDRPGQRWRCVRDRSHLEDRDCSGGRWRKTFLRYDVRGNRVLERTPGPTPDDPPRVRRYAWDGDAGAPRGHDSHSIQVLEVDPLGNERRSVPDAVFATIVEVSSDYSDEPTIGRSVDGVGRVVEERWTADRATEAEVVWRRTHRDHAVPPHVATTRFAAPGESAGTIWLYDDGLGGPWKRVWEVPRDETGATGFAGVARRRSMATRSVRETLPLACEAADTGAPCASLQALSGLESPARVSQLDALGRVVRTIGADGSVERIAYRIGMAPADLDGVPPGSPLAVVQYANAKGDLLERWLDDGSVVMIRACSNSLPPDPDVLPVTCLGPEVTTYVYEATGELSAIRDATRIDSPAHRVVYRYDTLGRRVYAREPNAGASEVHFDLAGNVAREVDLARGLETTFRYDALDRPVHVGTPEGEDDLTYVYKNDVNGKRWRRPWRVSGKTHREDRAYDGHGRLAFEAVLLRSSGTRLWKRTERDLAGRVRRVSVPMRYRAVATGMRRDRATVRFEYEGAFLRRVCAEAEDGDGCEAGEVPILGDVRYDARGRRRSARLPGGTRTWSYDVASRLASDAFVDGGGAPILRTEVASYDGLSNPRAVSISATLAGETVDLDFGYDYDVRNRLATWSVDGAVRERYAYDVLGNLVRHGDVEQRYAHPTKPHALTEVVEPGLLLDYDAAGHLASIRGGGEDRFFDFDSRGRMTCVGSGPGGDCDVLAVAYDAGGRRIRETTTRGARFFLGADLSHAPANPVTGRPAETRFDVTVDGERIAIRRLVGGSLGGGPYVDGTTVRRSVLSDRLRSASMLLDEEGVALRHTIFRPFGGIHLERGAGPEPGSLDRRTFAGHDRQEETGLVYMQARWMEPRTGRFLSVDPRIADPFDPQSLNAYSYVTNNPVARVDPDGRQARNGPYHLGQGPYGQANGVARNSMKGLPEEAEQLAKELAEAGAYGAVIETVVTRKPPKVARGFLSGVLGGLLKWIFGADEAEEPPEGGRAPEPGAPEGPEEAPPSLERTGAPDPPEAPPTPAPSPTAPSAPDPPVPGETKQGEPPPNPEEREPETTAT